MVRYAALVFALMFSAASFSQTAQERIVPGRYVVVYRNHAVPSDAQRTLAVAGAHLVARMDNLGFASVATSANGEAVRAMLATQPDVMAVLQDRYVTAHTLQFPIKVSRPAPSLPRPSQQPSPQPQPINLPISLTVAVPTGTYYDSPQGWPVQQAGGFGDNVPNAMAGSPATGPWNATRGAGVRIAILDSGIDAANPAVAPNLAVNLTEIDQTALPSACDDGGPQDQQGHGTWTASLAAAAIGSGQVIGVAPQATLLNIKVLQRMPAATGAASASQCEAGEAGGLLSWVLQGIDDAVSQHASVISLSLGTLVDITTGDGAGWQATFNQATYAASQSGAVIVAALGNDGLNLGAGNFIELPAQARDVLPVVASTNSACAENLAPHATCAAGAITRPSYSSYGVANAIAAPGGSYPEGTDAGVSGFVRGACSSGLPNTGDGLPENGASFGCFGFGHQQYVQAIGTSASAALVAGAAALLHAANPAWSPAQLITALQGSATTAAPMAEPRLNLPAALAFQQ